MTASYTLTERPLTDEEIARLELIAAGGVGRWIVLILLMLAPLAIAGVVMWLAPPQIVQIIVVIATLLYLALCFTVLRYMVRGAMLRRSEARVDIEEGVALVVTVNTDRVMVTPDDAGLDLLLFDLGDGESLLLEAPDISRYASRDGAPAPAWETLADADRDPDCWNRLAAPFSFPARSFALEFAANTGDLLGSITITGEYLAPDPEVGLDPHAPPVGGDDVAILRMSYDEIRSRSHRRAEAS